MTVIAASTPGAALAVWLHCGNGHEPVEWKCRPACFICGGDGAKGQVSDWRNKSTATFEENR